MTRKGLAEMAGWTLAVALLVWVVLWSLPIVITVLGAIAPFAVAALFIRWLIRRRRS